MLGILNIIKNLFVQVHDGVSDAQDERAYKEKAIKAGKSYYVGKYGGLYDVNTNHRIISVYRKFEDGSYHDVKIDSVTGAIVKDYTQGIIDRHIAWELVNREVREPELFKNVEVLNTKYKSEYPSAAITQRGWQWLFRDNDTGHELVERTIYYHNPGDYIRGEQRIFYDLNEDKYVRLSAHPVLSDHIYHKTEKKEDIVEYLNNHKNLIYPKSALRKIYTTMEEYEEIKRIENELENGNCFVYEEYYY